MKYVVILPDGISDVPIKELGGKTPLEVAKHPNMDWIAREGITGWALTIPKGMSAGSDVGCTSVFGYNPRVYYTGRAPIEAAAKGIELKEGNVAFRCNTVCVQEGIMTDYSAGHIGSDDSHELIKIANEKFGKHGVRFHPGVGYRHLAIVESGKWKVESTELAKIKCMPPHDIADRPIEPHLATGDGSQMVRKIMSESIELFKDHPVNTRRIKNGKLPATMLWLWGQGTAAQFHSFQKQFGLRAACISAVDIVRGLGTLMGFDIIQVPGITGYFDTNYKGKAEYALKALDDHDFVLIHIESTDEAGHMGDFRKKIQAIEDTDRFVVGTVLDGLKKQGEPFGVLLTPDHPTSTILKTHIPEAVPFAVYKTDGPKDNISAYTEMSIKASAKKFDEGFRLMSFFLQ